MAMKFRMLLFFFVLLTACTQKNRTSDSYLSYLPQNAEIIIKINHPDRFTSDLKNNSFISSLQKTKAYRKIQEKLRPMDSLVLQGPYLLAFYEVGKANFEYLLVVPEIPTGINGNPDTVGATFSYDNTTITQYIANENDFFHAVIDKNHVISSAQILLENAIRWGNTNSVPPALQKLYDTTDPNETAAIFINLDRQNSLMSFPLKDTTAFRPDAFADWISLDINSNNDALLLSGVAVARDSVTNFINLFKGTTPLSDRISGIAPQNSDAVLSYSFNDSEKFLQNQKSYLDLASFDNEELMTFEELGIIYLNNTKAIALTTFSNENLSQFLTSNTVGRANYQGTEIIELSSPKFVVNTFQPLISTFASNFYCVFDNTYVFAQDGETLQTLIANKKNGVTFDKNPAYTTIKSRLADEASILLVAQGKGLRQFTANQFSDAYAKDMASLQLGKESFAVQLIADGSFLHFNVLLTQIQKKPKVNTVAPLFTLELDNDLATDPVFVENHRTHKKEIVVQDQDNILYLISTAGKVLWKKQLEGRIRGKIHQVDIYKNGKLQLAFCTNNQFLVLDRNGEEVPPFNKKYEGGNVNPLAVFDYEKNKDYRFVVTQGKKVFMYNNKAEIVTGFTFTEANNSILTAPDHFRIAQKDYLLFRLEDGTLKILHRAGNDRIKVAERIDFSNNGIFLYKNKFSMTNKKGVLHQIDTKGKLTATNFNLGQNHGMYATSKTLALMDENVLSIKGKKVELELGVYTPPKIFYIYDKIYVSVTDIQNQKIHLYDSQGKPIPNFPVYGNSIVDMVDMDNDRKLELVAKDQENSIIVYGIN